MEQNLTILIEQLDTLKFEYIKLLNDQEVLLNWNKPQLEALYSTKIGVHKLALLELQLQIKALKRKLELVHSCINKNIKPDFDEIELIIAAELANAQQQIINETQKIIDGTNLLSNLIAPQNKGELKTLYHSLAKELHPDVNPNVSEKQKEIWHLVLKTYQSGDLDKLKALSIVYQSEIKGNGEQWTEEQITLYIASVKQGCIIIQDKVNAIKEDFPFIIEQQIKDDGWVASETKQIKLQIELLSKYEQELIHEYTTLKHIYD